MNEVAGLVFPEVVLEIESRIIMCKEALFHETCMDKKGQEYLAVEA